MEPSAVPDFSAEFTYQTSRSGGKGGQNVNKVETAASAVWKPLESALLPVDIKDRLLQKLASRLNKDGSVSVRATDTRSQLENRRLAAARLQSVIARALHVPKKRKASKPSKAAVVARLENKARASAKKRSRSSESWREG